MWRGLAPVRHGVIVPGPASEGTGTGLAARRTPLPLPHVYRVTARACPGQQRKSRRALKRVRILKSSLTNMSPLFFLRSAFQPAFNPHEGASPIIRSGIFVAPHVHDGFIPTHFNVLSLSRPAVWQAALLYLHEGDKVPLASRATSQKRTAWPGGALLSLSAPP